MPLLRAVVHFLLQFFPLKLKSLEIGLGRQHGKSLRNKIIPAVTGFDLNKIIQAAKIFNIGS